jgi:peptidoglycan/LPS O-acetylase OafA/YrhL
MTETKNRLVEFEALRGLSIVLLLLLHAHVFGLSVFGWFALNPVSAFVGAFLLGAFFFLAGYFFDMSIQRHSNNMALFIRSRFIRVFPPYWFAFLFFILMYTLKKFDTLVYFLNLQVIFSPTFVKPLLTLWYISLLFVFYIVFGALLWKIKSNLTLFIVSIAVFLVLYIVHLFSGLFDQRFFVYFFIFLSGVYFYRFEDVRERLFRLAFGYKVLLAALAVWVFWLVQVAELEWRNWLYILADNFFILTWVLMWLAIFRTKIGSWKIWVFFSVASYFAYLLHRPIWYGLELLVDPAIFGGEVAFHAVPASIVVLIVSYFLQLGYDRLLAALRLK